MWSKPATDGGNEITGYHVQRKEKNSTRWIKATKRPTTSLHFKITGLTENLLYEFRVMAENAAGLSCPSQCSEAVACKEPIYPPSSPGELKVVDTAYNSVKIEWLASNFDGGSPVTGYQVEARLEDEEKWSQCTPASGVKVTSYTITSLQQGKKYFFQVAAMNIAGIGEYAELPMVVEPVERTFPPTIAPYSDFRKNITVTAGSKIK